MTEEEKMMLRRLIVKEDELEELMMEEDRIHDLAGCGRSFNIERESKVARLSREIKILKDKLREICGE